MARQKIIGRAMRREKQKRREEITFSNSNTLHSAIWALICCKRLHTPGRTYDNRSKSSEFRGDSVIPPFFRTERETSCFLVVAFVYGHISERMHCKTWPAGKINK